MPGASAKTTAATRSSAWANGLLTFLFGAVVFGISYTQAPIYYSNQNQYFLHGLARAEWGHLDEDWLANTRDPTPLFSSLVAFTFRFVHESLFPVCYLLMLGLYFHSLVGIFTVLGQGRASPLTRLVFLTLLVVVHAGLLRLISAQLLGVDYPWYFQAGVAGQYVLGFGLQPSVSGVVLLASIHAAVRERPWFATILACLAGILHATYLLGAALLVLAYLYLDYRSGRVKRALLMGSSALVLVSPMVIYHLVAFAPSSTMEFLESQWILAHFRIPHHAEPERWFDGIALVQVAWIVLAMVLVRGSRLLVIMFVVFTFSLLLAGVQIFTGNDMLALLFPWRTSAVLVPLATTIVLACVSAFVQPRLERRPAGQIRAIQLACGVVLAACVAGGIAIYAFEWGYRTNPSELPMMEHVRSNRRRGEVYLLPVSLPKADGPRGAASTNFTSAPRAGTSGHLIAIDLQRFRIFTGAPIFVDFKSIPYKDVEVLEWYRRLLWAHALYGRSDWSSPDVLEDLHNNGITHVVTTADRDTALAALERVYADEHYRVYRVPLIKAK